jgi:hypothetical protein
MLVPVVTKCFRVIWTNDQNLGLTFCEFIVVPAQLRHVPVAEWSKESPVEDQQYVILTFEL